MGNNDKLNIGREIQDIVQDAISSMDFAKLNADISSTVSSALKEVKNAVAGTNNINKSSDNIIDDNGRKDTAYKDISAASSEPNSSNRYSYVNKEQYNYGRNNSTSNNYSKRNYSHVKNIGDTKTDYSYNDDYDSSAKMQSNVRQAAPKYKIRPRSGVPIPYRAVGNTSSVLKLIFGWIFAPMMILAEIITFIVGVAYDSDALLSTMIMLPITLALCGLIYSGNKGRKRNRRLMSYLKELQLKGYASIEQLANTIGESKKFVLKDVKKMLSLGMLPEGKIDQSRNCLIATKEAEQQYTLALESFEKREQDRRINEQLLEQERIAKNALSEEAKRTIKSGRDYMRAVREANDEIEDAEISAKLEKLEIIIDRILSHIEKHEDQLSEINKFMSYYLPTTIKLVNTYKEFDKQLVQGDNIIKAKCEISNTLDTINDAFAKLFDSLFEDAAMDVSTDISVLNTMLKQEGLTGKDFEL